MSKQVTVGTLPVCDFCPDPARYDAKTVHGPWAYMCGEDFGRHAAFPTQLGTGKGQMLVTQGEAEAGVTPVLPDGTVA